MSTPPSQPDPWLRGPIAGIPALLQPIAHAFIAAREDIDRAVLGLSPDQLWVRPSGAASIGFHIAHLAGSTDRLLTYARGEALSESQRADLAREREADKTRPPAEELVTALRAVLGRGLEQLAVTSEATLTEPRAVGRAQAASTVLGLLFHAAEHAARHAGQIVTTAKVIREAAAASFSNASLREARFADADLQGADFSDVNLASASFSNVALAGARFDDVNLSDVAITNANIEGMRINGVLVSEMRRVFDASSSVPS